MSGSGYGYRPGNFPQPQQNDLDFPDPPDWLDPWNKIFWCLNRSVRDKILLNRNGQNSKEIYFCVYNGFCTFHVNEIGRDRIEHHFQKNPSHRILHEDFYDWKELANYWKYLRNKQSQRFPPASSYHNNRYHENTPPREHRVRSPPTDYRREGTGYQEARFRQMPYHEGDRLATTRFHERSPPREHRARSSSSSFHRTWSPKERSPRDNRPPYQGNSYRDRSPRESRREASAYPRNDSPDRYRRESSYSRSPSVGRSRSPGARGESRRAPPFPSHTGRGRGRGKSYGSTPGAVGRYNSKLAMSASQIKMPTRRKEWVCLDQGILKGCEQIFHDQVEYNEHVKIRNLTRDKICPMRKEREEKKKEEKKASEFNVKNEWKGFKGPTEEITIPDSPPYIAPGEERGVSPPAGQEDFSVRDDGVLLLPELSSSSSALPDIITSTKPQESAPPKLRLPVVNRSSSPPASNQPPLRYPGSQSSLWNSPSPISGSDGPETRTPNKDIVRVRVVRSPERPVIPVIPVTQQSSVSPSSSSSSSKADEAIKVSVSTKKKENPKLPTFIRNSNTSSKPEQMKEVENTDKAKNTNQKENDDLALLLDKKIVRKQQLDLLSEKKKEATVEKTIPANVQKMTAESSSPKRLETLETALSLSDIDTVKSSKRTTEKIKTTETEVERTYVDKDKTKSILPETKSQKRKAVESSEEMEVKTRKTVSVSDRNQDSPSSDVDAHEEEVEEGETIESEPEGRNEDPLDDIAAEEMSTSQEMDPLELSPTPVATEEEGEEELEKDQQITEKETDGGVKSPEVDVGRLSEDIPKDSTESSNDDFSFEQFELEVASIVKEREERASVDSNTNKKSEEKLSETSNQPGSTCHSLNQHNNSAIIAYDVEHVFKEDGKEVRKTPVLINNETVWVECSDKSKENVEESKDADVSQLENCDNTPADLLEPSEEERPSFDMEREEANVLQSVEKEVDEFTEDEEEDPEVREVLELLEKEESDGAAGQDEENEEEAGEEEEEEEAEEEIVLDFSK